MLSICFVRRVSRVALRPSLARSPLCTLELEEDTPTRAPSATDAFRSPDRRSHSSHSSIAYYFLPILRVAVGGRDMYDGMPSVVVSIIYLCVSACIFVLCVRIIMCVYVYICLCVRVRVSYAQIDLATRGMRSVRWKHTRRAYILLLYASWRQKKGRKNWMLYNDFVSPSSNPPPITAPWIRP